MGPTTEAADESGKVRYRRTQSVTRAEEITDKQQKQRRSQPDKPIHKPRDSLFSWSSNFNDFTGLVNWGFLLLTMGGFRLLLENFIKYGIRVDPMQWVIVLTGQNEGKESYFSYPSLILVVYSAVPVIICLLIERGLSLSIIVEAAGRFAQVVNLLVLVLIPMIIIHVRGKSFSLFGAMTVCFTYSICFMKLWSYVQVNLWCRQALKLKKNTTSRTRKTSVSIAEVQQNREKEVEQNGNGNMKSEEDKEKDHSTPLVQYPNNLTVPDLLYFLCAPTLCYELNFPRTTRIRKRFLVKRILEVVIGINIVMALFQQWLIPSVRNSLVPFSNMEFTKITERLFKLAIPNHFIWLSVFYLVFHSFYNLLGEVMHFADRNFYSDWWNANNVEAFWRNWNMPVHRWCVRHLYIPIVELGYGKTGASVMVFFVSAFFHEYLVSVPLQTFKIWAFAGMMAQIPLLYVSKFVEKNIGPRTGNIIVWASLILGQPLAIMMYYHDFMVAHFQVPQDSINNSTIVE